MLALMAVVAFGCQPVLSFPQQLRVQLFQAQPAVQEIKVLGRVSYSIDGRRQETSGRGALFIRTDDGGGLTVLSVNTVPGGTGSLANPLFGREIPGRQVLISSASSEPITLSRPKTKGEPRRYMGTISVTSAPDGLHVVNTVPSLDYISSVVGSEMNPGFLPEALKAQAVLAQTLIARYKERDVLNDTTETQSYAGAAAARPEVIDAVRSVWHKLLLFNGKPAKIYYHSTCGGGTSSGAQYFDVSARSAPYLQAVICSSCSESPFIKEKLSSIPETVVAQRLGICDATVTATDSANRPLAVRVVDVSGKTRTMSGYQFWMQIGQKLGWDKVPGTRYSVSHRSDGRFEFRSTGAGHGVGLCQWGANGLAKQGKTYEQILNFYFPGTEVH